MPAGAITLAEIKSADWSLTLDTAGLPGSGIGSVVTGVDDVDQCIAIILTTPKGSDVCARLSAPTSGSTSMRRSARRGRLWFARLLNRLLSGSHE